jgi:hypothetical protein
LLLREWNMLAQRTGKTVIAAATISWRYRVLHWSLALALAILPFELTRGVSLPGLQITNVELVLLCTIGVWSAILVWERRLPALPLWFVAPAAVLLLMLLLSAGLAREQQSGAIKFVVRQMQGCLVAFCLAEQIRLNGWRLARMLLAFLTVGGVLSALLGLWEATGSPVALGFLSVFKLQPSLMAGLLRISATFSYANTAAMYYESILPVLIAGTAGLAYGYWRGIGSAAACLVFLALLLTYSRAALVTSVLLLVVIPLAVLWRWGWSRPARASVGLSGALVVALLLLMLVSPTFRLRLLVPDISTWYRATYEPVPIAPMAAREVRPVRVRVTNTGLTAWSPRAARPIRLSYHWHDARTGEIVHFEGLRTDLPHTVPGASVDLLAQVEAPAQPGEYLLAWDLVRDNTGSGWFTQMGSPAASVPVVVDGVTSAQPDGDTSPAPPAPETVAQSPPGAGEVEPVSPSRRLLWTAALQIWSERPWLGAGPDVFRHIYGPYLGLERWDDRIHTNNLYLEVLAGGGILSLAAFVLVLAPVIWRGLRVVAARGMPAQRSATGRAEADQRWWCMLICLLGLATFLVHGLMDVFLAFTPTYVLFWSWIGMIVGLSQKSDGDISALA